MATQERALYISFNWHLHLDAILMRFSFRNARNTIEYSFTFPQSKHINLALIMKRQLREIYSARS
jgi:hypothetical protein